MGFGFWVLGESELFVFVLTRVLVLCIKENIKQWVECVNRIYIETIRYKPINRQCTLL